MQLELGAQTVYVLHVGRIETPLEPPRHMWEVAGVCFEISRRHGFSDALANIPEGVTAHVLPSGRHPEAQHRHKSPFNGAEHEMEEIRQRIENGYTATREYLRQHAPAAAGAGAVAGG